MHAVHVRAHTRLKQTHPWNAHPATQAQCTPRYPGTVRNTCAIRTWSRCALRRQARRACTRTRTHSVCTSAHTHTCTHMHMHMHMHMRRSPHLVKVLLQQALLFRLGLGTLPCIGVQRTVLIRVLVHSKVGVLEHGPARQHMYQHTCRKVDKYRCMWTHTDKDSHHPWASSLQSHSDACLGKLGRGSGSVACVCEPGT